MILSDKSIREELASGGIVIEPLGENAVQPSSVDLHVDRYFRVFRNDTTPYIDPKQPQEDLTELVEVEEDGTFILHPGEFVLGSTLERVALGSDLVGRLEGKSSLGRLGLLIHSSLPAGEAVMVLLDGRIEPLPIDQIVRQRLPAATVSFDPQTFEVGYHPITDWYEGPPDRIYEVRLHSGRSVRVTAGHNLFTLDYHGELKKVRTGELKPGTLVAIPGRIPDPPRPRAPREAPVLDLLALTPDSVRGHLVCTGPAVATAFERHLTQVRALLREAGLRRCSYYRAQARLPLPIAERIPGLMEALGPNDRLGWRASRDGLPPVMAIDPELAWLLGIYVAEGSRRRKQFTISNTDQAILDRVEKVLGRFEFRLYRTNRAITGCSHLFSELLGWIGTGKGAHTKRIPPAVFSWNRSLQEAFLDGLVDGDGSRDATRVSVWTCSDGLAADVFFLAARLGLRAGSHLRRRGDSRLWQIYMPVNEHKLLTSVPLADRLLVEIREQAGLEGAAASRLLGYKSPTDLSNLENRSARDAVRVATLRRLRTTYARRPECPPALTRLDRLIDGGLLWDRVAEVRDTGRAEPIYDLEVRPGGRRVENFLAGQGGVFLSNTAGFVDAGWDGHLTLELSNVANLPIAIYPGMKIGQISFLRMSSEAEHPYGSEMKGSKYQGQRGPTPSRYYLNFREQR